TLVIITIYTRDFRIIFSSLPDSLFSPQFRLYSLSISLISPLEPMST
ncbi:unnamed protein product, partial [Brassica oleracea]